MAQVAVPAGVPEGGQFVGQLNSGVQLQVQRPAGTQPGQQIQIQAPAPLSMDRGTAAAAPQLPAAAAAAVAALGASVTFRQKLQNSSRDNGFASFGASCSGTLPVLDGNGAPSLSVAYASSDARLRQLTASLTAADGAVAIAEFQRPAAAGGMSSLIRVDPLPCQVLVDGQLYATITCPSFSNEARLARVADPRLGAAIAPGGGGCICCGPYTFGIRAVTGGAVSTRTVTVDSDPCLPACPPCLICAFNTGQRRVCELGDGDPLGRLDLLLLNTFMAVDPLTLVPSSS
jgi:hypothetical protein